jgi:phosphoribosylglycinamide formyltransferase 1
VKSGKIKVDLALLVCDNPKAKVLQRAKENKVKAVLVQREDFSSRRDFENRIIQHLKENKIDLIALAGFMRLLSAEFVGTYKGRIINIHPSLLPLFKGAHAIKDAFEHKVNVTGVTVHFVDEFMDHGPIILQKSVRIKKKETLSSLESRIHEIEHRLYPKALKLVLTPQALTRLPRGLR